MSGRKRRARCTKTTTRGTVELNGWLTSPMGCCCRAEGHVDSRANERTNRPPSAAVARSNRGWHSRYVGFHGSFPRRTHSTPRVMGLRPRPSPTTRGASDAVRDTTCDGVGLRPIGPGRRPVPGGRRQHLLWGSRSPPTPPPQGAPTQNIRVPSTPTDMSDVNGQKP